MFVYNSIDGNSRLNTEYKASSTLIWTLLNDWMDMRRNLQGGNAQINIYSSCVSHFDVEKKVGTSYNPHTLVSSIGLLKGF